MAKVVRIDNYTKTDTKKTRVAAYARVSTDSAEQLASLEAQKNYYDAYIKAHPEWEYAGLYYDEGISGVHSESRDGLQRLLADCRNGRVDYIIVKSISRLARNTVDCLEIVRELYDLKIYLYFERENINTSRMESELLLAILSSLAEAESKSISQNEKWAIQKRFENGTYIIGSPPYGYRNVNGVMEIVPEQAETVRWIFSRFLAGTGSSRIAKELNENGTPSKHGGKWTGNTIIGLIKNEKFTGDVTFQKTYTDEQFKRHKNKNGERDQYLAVDHHEAIISREDFEAAKALLEHNRSYRGIECDSGKYGKRYPLSGKIICGECGATWKRRVHQSKAKGDRPVYVCTEHLNNKNACSIMYIHEETFYSVFCTVMNKLTAGRDVILKPFLAGLVTMDGGSLSERRIEIDRLLEECEEKKKQLHSLMIKQYLDEEVFAEESERLFARVEELKAERDAIGLTLGGDKSRIKAAEELISYTGRGRMMTKFDENVFDTLIEYIRVISRNELELVFRCGLTLKERF